MITGLVIGATARVLPAEPEDFDATVRLKWRPAGDTVRVRVSMTMRSIVALDCNPAFRPVMTNHVSDRFASLFR